MTVLMTEIFTLSQDGPSCRITGPEVKYNGWTTSGNENCPAVPASDGAFIHSDNDGSAPSWNGLDSMLVYLDSSMKTPFRTELTTGPAPVGTFFQSTDYWYGWSEYLNSDGWVTTAYDESQSDGSENRTNAPQTFHLDNPGGVSNIGPAWSLEYFDNRYRFRSAHCSSPNAAAVPCTGRTRPSYELGINLSFGVWRHWIINFNFHHANGYLTVYTRLDSETSWTQFDLITNGPFGLNQSDVARPKYGFYFSEWRSATARNYAENILGDTTRSKWIANWRIHQDETFDDFKLYYENSVIEPYPSWGALRGVVDFGASTETSVVPFGKIVDPSSIFVRLTNACYTSGGDAAGTQSARTDSDLGATINNITPTEFTIERESGGDNADMRHAWEAWEGPFDVRDFREHTILSGTGTTEIQVSGFTDINQCVPILCASRSNGGAYKPEQSCGIVWLSGAASLKIQTQNVNNDRVFSVSVIEFGDTYTIYSYEHTFSAAGVVETETITDVTDTTKCMLFSSYYAADGSGQISTAGHLVYFENSTTLNFYLSADHTVPAGCIVRVYIIKNESFEVEHISSFDAGYTHHPAGSVDPQTIETSASAVTSLSTTGLIGWAVTDLTDGNGSQGSWNYRLKDTDNQSIVEWFRAEHGGSAHWALSIAQFGEIQAADDAYSINASAEKNSLLFVTENDIYNGSGTLAINAVYNGPSLSGTFVDIVDANGDTGTAATHLLYNNPERKTGADSFGYTLTDDGGVTESNTATVSLTITSDGGGNATIKTNIGGGVSTALEI